MCCQTMVPIHSPFISELALLQREVVLRGTAFLSAFQCRGVVTSADHLQTRLAELLVHLVDDVGKLTYR